MTLPKLSRGDDAMAVLHVDTGRAWGGGQNQVRLLMRWLADHGVGQLCLCPDGSPLERSLRTEGLPVRGVAWIAGGPRTFLRVFREVRDWDLVHCHDAHALHLTQRAARLRGKPVVAARHSLLPPASSGWKRAAAVLAISAGVRQRLLAAGVDEARVHTVYSGVDPEELRRLEVPVPTLRERIGLGSDVFLAGSVGTLVRTKNQVFLTQVAARLRDTEWVVIGEGPERDAMRQAIVAHGIRGSFHLPGHLPDARRYLPELDVFVYAAAGEGLGTSLLDAMGRDVPVIAAADAGPEEILAPVHASTGASLYPPGNADAAAALVGRVRAEPELRKAMVAAQRKRLPAFRAARTAALTLGVYRSLLERE